MLFQGIPEENHSKATSAAVLIPDWVSDVESHSPFVILSAEACEDSKQLLEMIEILVAMGVNIVLAIVGRVLPPHLPDDVWVTQRMPSPELCRRAQLLICSATNRMARLAESSGVPLLGIVSNKRQFRTMTNLARTSTASFLQSSRFNRHTFAERVSDLIITFNHYEPKKVPSIPNRVSSYHLSSRDERVLVTGGTGLIGSNIIKMLLSEGREVRALVRSPQAAERIMPQGCEIVQGDVRDGQSLKAAMQGCATVFHAAAALEQWIPDTNSFYAVNAGGTQNIVEAALKQHVSKFIYLSTVDILEVSKDGWCDECSVDQQAKESPYARSKQLADNHVCQAVARGLPAVLINPAATFGPCPQQNQWFLRFVLQLHRGELPLLPPGGMPMVFVEDVARGCLLAEKKGQPGERFLLCESHVTFKRIAKAVLGANGQTRTPPVMPCWSASLLAAFGAQLSRITKRPPLVHRPLLDFWRKGVRPDNRLTRERLGWNPRSFEAGVQETVQYLRERSLLP